MIFWVVAGFIALAVILMVCAPLMRGGTRGTRRASYDMQVHRDQLREIDTDLARGVLTEQEAKSTRIEISRRLLAAADQEAAEADSIAAPRALSRVVVPGLIVPALLLAGGMYWVLGAPGYPDQPRDLRLQRQAEARANRPGQEEAEGIIAQRQTQDDAAAPAGSQPDPGTLAMLEQLKTVLEGHPDQEEEGRRMRARGLASIGRWSEAYEAQARLIELRGETASAQDYVDLGEWMILAAGGYVSPEAEAALNAAMTRDQRNPLGRYYSGLAMLQARRPDLTYQIWAELLEEGPPDAPWVMTIQQGGLDEVARLAGIKPAGPAPGPTRSQVEAAGEMSGADRQAMIEGMVGQLSERLAQDGGTAAEWAKLIRALGVLGRITDAGGAWEASREAYADDPAALEMLAQAARDANLTQ
jgi:cytochrome c-type biogenesis protein CcmH